MKTPNKKSALSEIHGVAQPETLSTVVASQIQQFRRKQPSAEELIAGILKGDKTALSRAITLVESTNPEHLAKANEVIKGCLPHANNSVRIGITGVPGVGKSTFIEAFGKYLLKNENEKYYFSSRSNGFNGVQQQQQPPPPQAIYGNTQGKTMS